VALLDLLLGIETANGKSEALAIMLRQELIDIR